MGYTINQFSRGKSQTKFWQRSSPFEGNSIQNFFSMPLPALLRCHAVEESMSEEGTELWGSLEAA